ncbi:hypothetical protein KKG48_01835 [Patescibacteria group bacterium]|nr:hypothetical protein [Patescibacteria group bacterium]MCG2695104.1 hypothetical protein [Candidatus Parcubacteria bacterium]
MKLFKVEKKLIFTVCFSVLLLTGVGASAANSSEFLSFNIDSSYDSSARNTIDTVLVRTTAKLYFYFEKSWWDSQMLLKKNEILGNLDLLSQEFDNKIYPILTSVFGQEWKPGIDGDERITLLFHSMKEGAGGYFRSNDEYLKIQSPTSNEREMLYLSVPKLDNLNRLKVLLAHEFVHLITFNQKEKTYGKQEEVWLNESRAEYSATLLGYNDNYAGSILQERMKDFLENPSDSLTEWRETKYDYAAINSFVHYLVEHYGIEILIDSLKSELVGIPSINEILQKKEASEDFSQIFTNWTIAVWLNNCALGNNYCYVNPHLSNIHIIPNLNFLPFSGKSSLSVTNITKNWAGNWQKIFGGSGKLTLEFSSLKGLNFQVPYLVQAKDGSVSLNFLSLDENQKGELSLSNFGTQNTALILIPSLQTKLSGFNGNEFTYPYTFTVSISGVQTIPGQNNPLLPQGFIFQKNLYFGMLDQDVVYLKIILAAEGCVSGLANTTYFGPKTLEAVKCFQNKYKSEISAAAGYTIKGTGFVGTGTKDRLNILLGE